MEIGSIIRNARNGAKLSQEHAAEALGVSRQTISSWENGKTYPDIILVIKMSDLFACNLLGNPAGPVFRFVISNRCERLVWKTEVARGAGIRPDACPVGHGDIASGRRNHLSDDQVAGLC